MLKTDINYRYLQISWRRRWHPTPVLLPGKSHGWRSLVGCSPWGCEELDTTKRLHFHFSLSCIGEGNGNPLQYSCLENPRDGGAWWAAVYGVAQSRTWLKRLSSSSSNTIASREEVDLERCCLRRRTLKRLNMWFLSFYPLRCTLKGNNQISLTVTVWLWMLWMSSGQPSALTIFESTLWLYHEFMSIPKAFF